MNKFHDAAYPQQIVTPSVRHACAASMLIIVAEVIGR